MIVRLDTISKEEMRDLAARFRPDWTRADFEHAWIAFLELKHRKTLN